MYLLDVNENNVPLRYQWKLCTPKMSMKTIDKVFPYYRFLVVGIVKRFDYNIYLNLLLFKTWIKQGSTEETSYL
jgi:hypothetical protein